MDHGVQVTGEAAPHIPTRPDHAIVAAPAPRPPRRHGARPWIVAAVVFALISGTAATLQFVAVDGAINHGRRDAAELRRTLATERASLDRAKKDLAELRAEAGQLRADLDDVPDPAEIVAGVQDSVFAVYAGPWEGTAFVVASGSGTSTLLTNFHVVEDAWQKGVRRVVLHDDDGSFNGRIGEVYAQPDLALIEVDRSLRPLDVELGVVQVGDPVVVVGSAYGYERTVSTGVVSALRGRYVQFSAATSPGSSGSPVLDRDGKVIGVAGAKVVGRGVEGLSFAIAIWRLCQVSDVC